MHLLGALSPSLHTPEYVTGELDPKALVGLTSMLDATDFTIDAFYKKSGPDILEKCKNFRPWVDDMMLKELYQRFWRVTLTSALDHEITVFDPIRRTERPMICFDSNSYLGLHRDPRVIERTAQVLRAVGYGTPSAQMLGGTNRYLRELEDDLSDFLGREDTIIFPTGFAANIGAVGALVRKDDAVFRDRFAHASIQDACRSSQARFNSIFAHNDMSSLSQLLEQAGAEGCQGKLIVTDGVFSMHGRIAPLPDLAQLAKRHSARLMIDDAHGVGVLGANGRGIEEHWGQPGAADILMGTLSKALGAIGGYVSGSKDLIYYLRFYATSGMFTTSLPAAICAGLREALQIIRNERHQRDQLWANIRAFSPALREAGFIVPDAVSPITTIFMGNHRLMLEFSRELFDAGIKCGNVMFPVVSKGEAILRFTLNARHTPQELQYALDILIRLGTKWGVLHRSPEETFEIGRRIRHINPPRAPQGLELG
ncbi:MAG TPA: pyridoxal phosphate-dependent aminotransferase family protein [Polyangiaceae bacterium]|nr:pyridoxal phosphate-dependent aminotransferase family protein [Polyangiaceae bacterium]